MDKRETDGSEKKAIDMSEDMMQLKNDGCLPGEDISKAGRARFWPRLCQNIGGMHPLLAPFLPEKRFLLL